MDSCVRAVNQHCDTMYTQAHGRSFTHTHIKSFTQRLAWQLGRLEMHLQEGGCWGTHTHTRTHTGHGPCCYLACSFVHLGMFRETGPLGVSRCLLKQGEPSNTTNHTQAIELSPHHNHTRLSLPFPMVIIVSMLDNLHLHTVGRAKHTENKKTCIHTFHLWNTHTEWTWKSSRVVIITVAVACYLMKP